jgi:prevent-host-death family protein
MRSGTWTVAEAKAGFSELLDKVHSQGPQIVTKHGRKAAIVVSPEEWERKIRRTGTLADFFAHSPLRKSDIEIERSKDRLREVDL